MSGNSSPTPRIGPNLVRGGALDALRFAAAFFMVLYHYAEQAPVSLFEVHDAFSRGYLATNFFLMLSGFVLASAYGPRLDEKGVSALQFVKKRIARVYPGHLVMIAAFLALYAAVSLLGLPMRNPQWFDWSQLPAQIFLVQAWGLPGVSGWNIVTWSLSALIFCYIVFPFAWRVFNRIGAAWLGLVAAVALLGVADVLTHAFLGFPVYQMPLRIGVLRALPLFLLGVALARVAATLSVPRFVAVIGTLGSFAAIILLQLGGRHDYPTLVATSTLMLSAALWRHDTSRTVRSLAALAFALFITNFFFGVVWFGVLRVVEDRLGLHGAVVWALWAVALPAAVVFAWLFDRLIDAPLQAAVKPMLTPRGAGSDPTRAGAYQAAQ
jgi:peptidoglycan/LPS O-acetylase OafA/YrhL